MTGAIDMNSNKITELATGTASTDAVNKSQVMLLDGSQSMTNNLDLQGFYRITGMASGTDFFDAINRTQFETELNTKADTTSVMLLDGSQGMTGAIDMNSNKITELAAGTASTDAVNKSQVMLVDGSHTMSQPLPMNWKQITELAPATSFGDAVRKSQLDDKSDITSVMLLDGSQGMTGVIDMNSNKITELATGTAGTDAVNKSQLDTALDGVLLLDGSNTMTSSIDMGTNRVRKVATPISFDDAANKSYVDTELGNKADTTSVMLLDGSQGMTGAIDMNSNKITELTAGTSSTDAVNKSQVMLLNGSQSMSAAMNMNSNKITGLATPTISTDAANKAYVDAEILNPAYFSAQLGTTGSSDDTTPSKIVWTQIDLSNLISHVGGNITVVNAGIYCVSANVMFKGESITERYCLLQFKVNTTLLRSAIGQLSNLETGTDYDCVSMSFVTSLTTGANYSFDWVSGSNNDTTIDFRSHCSFHRIA